MKQWRKEPWVPLSLSDRSLSLWPRINVFTSCREVIEKIFSPEKSQRKSTETREVQCSLNSDLSNIQHVTQKGCSLLVIGDSKWNLHEEILGRAVDSEHHPEPQKRVPQSTESQSYSVAVDRRDGAGKINMGAPRKYTRGKSGFILSDVRENPYIERLFWFMRNVSVIWLLVSLMAKQMCNTSISKFINET